MGLPRSLVLMLLRGYRRRLAQSVWAVFYFATFSVREQQVIIHKYYESKVIRQFVLCVGQTVFPFC